MHRKRRHEAPFSEFDERVARERQEAVERVGARECCAERQEMQRQENRQRYSRQPVQQCREKTRPPMWGGDHCATLDLAQARAR